MFSLIDLLRLCTAFAAIFVVLPYLAMRRKGDGSLWRTLTLGFVQAAFFVQISAMVLGDWKLYLPGAAAASYMLWLGVTAVFARRRNGGPLASSLPSRGAGIARLLEFLEERPAVFAPLAGKVRQRLNTPVAAGAAVIAAAVALRGVWFALHHVRLQRLESYSRTISLHSLIRGDAWDHDPSVALLAPLAWLSGLTPDHVIRLSGGLVAAAMVLAMAFAGWRRLGTAVGAILSAAFFAATLLWLNLTPSEPGGAEWSAIFVILAVGLAGEAWGVAALALLTAALIHAGLSPVLLPAALALTMASLIGPVIGRAPAAARLVPSAAALAILVAAILTPLRPAAPEHQYEAAARVAHRIAAEFRTNDWILVSPGLEVAQTYGRGWHVELADFVDAHTEAKLADPAFRFSSYATESMFVFVEKRVLKQPAFSFAHDAGATSYYYTTRLGRSSLEFRAARLMAAYVSAHKDATVYYEDDDLMVYRVARPADPETLSARR